MENRIYPKEEIIKSIQEAISYLSGMKANQILYLTDYENLRESVNRYHETALRESFVNELKLILKIEYMDLNKDEKMSLYVKSIRRLHECLAKLLFIFDMSSDEKALIFLLEYLYTIGKIYFNSIEGPKKKVAELFYNEQNYHALILTHNNIEPCKIEEYYNLLKNEKKLIIPEKLHGIARYKKLDEYPIKGFNHKNLLSKSMYFKYSILSEYTHAKDIYSLIIGNFSELLPLLFVHELSYLTVRIFSEYIFHCEKKDGNLNAWINDFDRLSNNYVQLWKVTKTL